MRPALLAWLLVALAGTSAAAQEAGGWDAAWSDLARLKRLERGSSEAGALAARLFEVVREHRGEPRGELLEAQLALWRGTDPRTAATLEMLPSRTFSGEESWLLVEVLPPGEKRVAALLRALATTESLSREELLLAWNTAVDEALALRLSGTRSIQESLDARYRATWSAIDLALTYQRLGEGGRADAVLAEAIAREESLGRPTAELWSRRGIAAFGNGDDLDARHYLGRSLAQGFGDASVVLGLMDLLDGRLDAARMGFRASILSDPPAPWGLRGWGMTLLPRPLEGPRLR